ncbi:MAG: hypothetical protein PHW14_05600, partial [Candidatus Omnitrophica bacterium]|nr:hypothetical protein [Candidatus Omnitrophota bacterium]
MKTTFKARILISFITVIAVLGSSMGVLGFYIIRRDILEKTRAEVRQGLASARMEYGSKIAKIRNTIDLVSPGDDLGLIAKKGRLDYLYYVPASERDMATSEIVLKAFQGQRLGGTRVMGPEEIKAIGPDFYENIRMEVKPTPKAAPSDRKDLDSALAIEYAMPVKGELWGEDGVLYGGR